MSLDDRDYYREEQRKRLKGIEEFKRTVGRKNKEQKKTFNRWLAIIFAFVVMVAIVSFNLYTEDKRKYGKSPVSSLSSPGIQALGSPKDLFLKEEPIPENGACKLFLPKEEYIADLKLIADPYNNYVVKLSEYAGNPALIVFVRAGEIVETKMPLGTYEFKWICGKKWYGYEKLFGSNSEYNKAYQPINFINDNNGILSHTVKFNTMNGNMPSTRIRPEEF